MGGKTDCRLLLSKLERVFDKDIMGLAIAVWAKIYRCWEDDVARSMMIRSVRFCRGWQLFGDFIAFATAIARGVFVSERVLLPSLDRTAV